VRKSRCAGCAGASRLVTAVACSRSRVALARCSLQQSFCCAESEAEVDLLACRCVAAAACFGELR
jgi:hypothetical protein